MYVEPEMARYYLSILKEGRGSSNVAYKEKKFREFHDSLCMDLYRKIRARYKCDHDVAEDVLSEVFIKVFNTTHYPENPATFYAWVLMICKNEFVNFCRKNKNSSYMSMEAKIEQGIGNDDAADITKETHQDSINNLCEFKGADIEDDEGLSSKKTMQSSTENNDINQPNKEFIALPHNVHTEDLPDDVYDSAKKNSLIECVQNALRILRSKSLDKGLVIEWHMEGLSSKEMADLLKRTDDATRRLLSDARKMLRELSAPCYEMIG